MTEQDRALPFLELFLRLRARGIPLVLRDYQDLGKALQGQFGIDAEAPDDIVKQEAAFVFLCRLLWTRSPEEETCFDELWAQRKQELRLLANSQPSARKNDGRPPRRPDGGNAPDGLPLPQSSSPGPPASTPSKEMEETARDLPLPVIDSSQPAEAYQSEATWFHFTDDCYDLSFRQMCQAWRKLNRPTKGGLTNELDLPQTIQQFARTGMLDELVFQPRYHNNTRLIILADSLGSMTAFHGLTTLIVRAAEKEGCFDYPVQTYYFSNFPDKQFYHDFYQNEPLEQSSLWPKPGFNAHLSVLFISDAGAARGVFDADRVTETNFFLKRLQIRTQRVAWVNPMPRSRWEKTSAKYIAREVPMFEATPAGFRMAIDQLK